jgi:hypothetical protein
METLPVGRLQLSQRIAVGIAMETDRHWHLQLVADEPGELFSQVSSLEVSETEGDGDPVIVCHLTVFPLLREFDTVPQFLGIRCPCRRTPWRHGYGTDDFFPEFSTPEVVGFTRSVVDQFQAQPVRSSSNG